MFSPSKSPPWLRLMRLDKPTGLWLLYWPCAWSLLLASETVPWRLLALFLSGAVLMRGAGCVVNDLIDRDLDRRVSRTATRPLASGEVSAAYAIWLLSTLLTLSLGIAWLLGPRVVLLSAGWLIPVILYPFMKRITWWPQLFLGLTFSAGAPIGWTAATGDWPGVSAWLLFAAGVAWTLGYDTIYAHQDRRDDETAGIRSTARRLGPATKPFVTICYLAVLITMSVVAYRTDADARWYPGLLVAGGQMAWQVLSVDLENSASCWRIFRSNIVLGAWFAVMFAITHIV